MEQIIYLEDDDDIASIRDRLDWAQSKQVLLVVPPGNKVLASTLNLKLLQRHAANLALEVALITKDRVTQELAYELGLPFFSSAARAQRRGWHGGARAEELPARVRKLEGKQPRLPSPLQGESPQLVQQIIALFFFGALLLPLLAGAMLVVPSATVTLRPAIEPISEIMEVQADPEVEQIDYESGRIPAGVVQVEVEGTGQIPTSAKKDAADTRATGTVIFVNQREAPIAIPLGTGVSTSSGTTIRFTTVETETLPARGMAEVNIIAVDPGPSGNVQRHLINTVEDQGLALQVKVINDKPTGGGNVRQVGVVTQADKDRLKASLLQELQQRAYARLLEQLKEQEFIPPQSLVVVVIDEIYDTFVEEEADALGLKMRIRASGTAYGGHHANILVLHRLQVRVKEGYRLIQQGLEFRPGEVTKVENRKVTFVMKASGLVAAQIDASGVRDLIRGQPVAAAEEYLHQRLPLREKPTIQVTPHWLGRVPWLPFRIHISVEEEV